VRLGTTEALPEGKRETGANNTFGGPIATAGGLVFIGATSDSIFRAFDAETGKILWQEQLDYGAMTVPVTYRGADGRQYVAVMASGSAFGGPLPRGPDGKPLNNESLIAFALPE
jgi:quinoprotein glucose dehydrogenase